MSCLNSAYFQDAGHPEKLYKLGQAVRAKVVEVSSKPQRFVLSLTGRRSSDCQSLLAVLLVLSLSPAQIYQMQRDRQQFIWFWLPFCFPGVYKLEKGSVTLGMVTNIQPQVGLQVKLPFGGTGTVTATDLADAYRPNALDGYSKDQLLRSVDAAATLCCT